MIQSIIHAVDWVTAAYVVPVVVGLTGVAIYITLQAAKAFRFERKHGQEPVVFREPVLVRRYSLRQWSRPYGDSMGSRGIDLVIRSRSVEIVYVGRPLGGIGGMQWFFDPANTVMTTGPAEWGGQSLILTEEHGQGSAPTTVALVGGSFSRIEEALSQVGVRSE